MNLKTLPENTASPAAKADVPKGKQAPGVAKTPADALALARDLVRRGEHDSADTLLSRILKANPRNVQALIELAVVKLRQSERGIAREKLEAALKISPDNAIAQKLLGLCHLQEGRTEEALKLLEVAVAALPSDGDAHFFLSQALTGLKRYQEALNAISKALKLRPDAAAYVNALGTIFTATQQEKRAVPVFYRALDLKPDMWQARLQLGHALMRLNRHKEAISHYKEVSLDASDRSDVLTGMGNAYAAMEDIAAAGEIFKKLQQLYPKDANVYQAVANFSGRSNSYHASIANYRKALELQPKFPEAHNNLAITLRKLNQVEESLHHLDKAIEQKPGFADAHWNRALSLLLLGDFDRGFEEYEWRWKGGVRDLRPRKFGSPAWERGQDLAGKRLFVHSEQGLGDHIQFYRYFPQLVDQGIEVTAEVPEALTEMMRHAMPQVEWFERRSRAIPRHDANCALLSLPHILCTQPETIPFPGGYIAPSPRRVEKFNGLLGPKSKPRVGLVWSGNPKHLNDANRSVTLAQILSAFDGVDVDLVCLMKEIRPTDREHMKQAQHVRDMAEHLDDFSDTAALISMMDLVVTVDTSVAHLAGALGAPVWVLVPFSPDWRWMLNRVDTPWYRSMRLIRQQAPQQWAPVLETVKAGVAKELQ